MDNWKQTVYSTAQRLAQSECNAAYKAAWMKQKNKKKVSWTVPESAERLMQLSRDINEGIMTEETAKGELLRVRLIFNI